MLPITFQVSSIRRMRRQTPHNEYTDYSDPQPMWCVSLRNSWQPDRYLQMWMTEEAQAARVPKGDIPVKTLFDIMEPLDVRYTVGSINQGKLFLGLNLYTGKPDLMDSWTVGFEATTSSAPAPYFDLIYPNQAEADMWSFDYAYGPLDFLRVFKIVAYSLPPPSGGGFSTNTPFVHPNYPAKAPILTVTPGDEQNLLSWSGPSGSEVSYSVFRGLSAGQEDEVSIASLLTDDEYIDDGLTNGVTYYYKISVIINQTSLPSNEASGTPEPPPPEAPTELEASPGDTYVSLNWTPDPDGGSQTYNVYRGTSPGGESGTPIVSGLTAPNYTDTGLTDGTTYYYVVNAANGGGTSPDSSEASATPISHKPPPAVTGLVASYTLPDIGDGVTLDWNHDTNSTTYNVYRATAPFVTLPLPLATGLTSNTYADTPSTGFTYYYRVAGVNAFGTGPGSNQASIIYTTPVTPTLTAKGGIESVVLEWSASFGAEWYSLHDGDGDLLRTGIVGDMITATGLENDQEYSYKIAAVNAFGSSALSNEASATTAPEVIGYSSVEAPTGKTYLWYSYGFPWVDANGQHAPGEYDISKLPVGYIIVGNESNVNFTPLPGQVFAVGWVIMFSGGSEEIETLGGSIELLS